MPTNETFYSVTITAPGGAVPSDGGIDNTTVETYGATGPAVSSFANSVTKKRANLRYTFICQQIGMMCNGPILDIVAPGADANTAATSFTFVLDVERGDGVLSTPDELNPGQFLTGAAAIKRCVARALCEGRASIECAVFDPTATTSFGNGGGGATANMRVAGQRIEQLAVGKLFAGVAAAEAAISVAKVA